MVAEVKYYATECRAIAGIFERNEQENGRAYALSQLRSMLNALSNEALQETQNTRDGMGLNDLLALADKDWKEGKRND